MAKPDEERAPKSRSIGPLSGLAPFLRPYRLMVWGALISLTITAGLSLALPLAVRRVIDGFFGESLVLMDEYFGAAIGIAALLALGTAARFYLVTRLGERVVADIRRAIYDRVIGLSPGFYERLMTGEVLSRLTTDTTLVLSVIGSSVSIALRNLLTLLGGLALMFFTSAKLAGLVLIGVPLVVVPILTLGRRLRALSRENQDRIAESSAQAAESLLAAQTVQVALLSVAVFGFFLGFGVLIMQDRVISLWMGTGAAPSHVWWDRIGLPLPISAELAKVSVFLAAFAALYFTIYAVSDATYRREFFAEIDTELTRAVGVRAVYAHLVVAATDADRGEVNSAGDLGPW